MSCLEYSSESEMEHLAHPVLYRDVTFDRNKYKSTRRMQFNQAHQQQSSHIRPLNPIERRLRTIMRNCVLGI